jgi:hypothetical protein
MKKNDWCKIGRNLSKSIHAWFDDMILLEAFLDGADTSNV